MFSEYILKHLLMKPVFKVTWWDLFSMKHALEIRA